MPGTSEDALRSLEEAPWFNEGLRFTCTGCGACCTGPSGAVYLSQPDIDRLARYLDLTPEAFRSRYTQPSDSQVALADSPGTSECVFLKEDACTVYEARPTQCRTYPFWLINILTPDDWTDAALTCEGIDYAGAPLLRPAEVFEQCRADLENEVLDQ